MVNRTGRGTVRVRELRHDPGVTVSGRYGGPFSEWERQQRRRSRRDAIETLLAWIALFVFSGIFLVGLWTILVALFGSAA